MVEPIPMKPTKPVLAQHETIPNEIREKTGSLDARMNRIKRVLLQASALPEIREQAKADLVGLAAEALELWRTM